MVNGGWEREAGHYRAGLNSIPVIERFRTHPDEWFLLEVAACLHILFRAARKGDSLPLGWHCWYYEHAAQHR